ncbi:MAG: LamG domain-containing protein [Candidatus Brocadiaceae bacterium]|nr:LamG domain-containing protein [Candidatus Brocadiaceae bacterium]
MDACGWGIQAIATREDLCKRVMVAEDVTNVPCGNCVPGRHKPAPWYKGRFQCGESGRGGIDEVRIYSQALSDQEILTCR